MSPITIIDQQKRLREAGRIRIGQKVSTAKGGGRPEKLDTFRFTSADKAAIDRIAQLYGGESRQWEDAPVGEQFEVHTEAKAIPVLVPPTGFSFSQYLELWSGGGCKRRCDGEQEFITGGDCLCDPEHRECKPHSRLSVILLDLESMGTWRLDTQGWHAATELAGAMDIVKMAGERGRMIPGRLLLEQREARKPGEAPKRFAVPVLDLAISLSALTGGVPARAGGLTPVPAPEVPPLSVAEQLEAAEHCERPARKNAAATLPATGRPPRPAALAAAATPADDTSPKPPPRVRERKATKSAPPVVAPAEPPTDPEEVRWPDPAARERDHSTLTERIKRLPPDDVQWCRDFIRDLGWPLAVEDFRVLKASVADFEAAAAEALG